MSETETYNCLVRALNYNREDELFTPSRINCYQMTKLVLGCFINLHSFFRILSTPRVKNVLQKSNKW